MSRYVLLIRGINVGGRRLLMDDLRAVLGALGADRVETYIQSGNAVFEADEALAEGVARQLPEAIQARHGFAPNVIVLSADRLARLMADNPFPECADTPKAMHLYILAGEPVGDAQARLSALAAANERVQLGSGALYLCAPDGIGRSKLADRLERTLGIPATGRNWRTIAKLLEMAGQET